MTIPRAHRKWLVIFVASVVAWVAGAAVTMRSTKYARVFVYSPAVNVYLRAAPHPGYVEFASAYETASGYAPDVEFVVENDFTRAKAEASLVAVARSMFAAPPPVQEQSSIVFYSLPLWLLPLTVLIAWGAWTWRAKRRGERDEVEPVEEAPCRHYKIRGALSFERARAFPRLVSP